MNITHQNNQKLKNSKKKEKKSPNKISTTLYNIYTFIPLGIYNQFKLISNIYFLFIAILSIIPEVSPIDPYSAFLPVLYVILFSLCFDWYYDLKRYISDKKTNNSAVTIIRNNEILDILAQDIEIGDFLIIKENQRTMADIVLLTFKSTNDYCFIDTSSLDGEKTLKPKYSILIKNLDIQTFQSNIDQNNSIILKKLILKYQENEEDLNNFEARIKIQYHNSDQDFDIKQNLDINNFIPRTAMIRNTEFAIGLVVYVGLNTKVMKNMQQRIFKKSSLEQRMHRYILYILFFMIILMFFLALYSLLSDNYFDFDKNILRKNFVPPLQFLMTILSYITLMNTIIPISLIITFQITKLVQNFLYLTQDKFLDKENNKKTLINSTDLNEELGQVEYILSDKTGTLTQNKMVAKNFLIQYQNQILQKEFLKNQLDDFEKITLKSKDQTEIYEIDSQERLNFFFYLLVNTNHDCFAKGVINEDNFEDQYEQLRSHIQFEGPSPDEIALLKGSKNYCHFLLKGADSRICTLLDQNNQDLLIEKVFIFKFDSNRKMMSIIIKYEDKYFLMCKGADTSVVERSIYKPKDQFWQQVDEYLEEGLRVMFMSIKLISKEELDKFQSELEILQNSEESSSEQIYQFKQTIEQDMYLIGASAIEDKLQENLQQTIEILKLAKIKIWVITGDKSDTARNIAYASGLFDKDYKTIEMDEDLLEDILNNVKDLKQIQKQNKKKFIWRWSRQIEGALNKEKIPTDTPITPRLSLRFINRNSIIQKDKQNLLVPGKVLAIALKSNNKNTFTNYLKKFQCVVFSRTNPKQKVEIVRLLKNQNIKTLAIGDGANDVNMIQEANIGIGIIGEEGKQAINASDYAIPSFQYLQHLILNFGRICYYNNSAYILQFFYKNIFVTMTQFYYAFQSDFSSSNIYHDWYLAVYNMFFTAFMHPGMAIQNIDINDKAIYYQPGYILEAYVYYYGQYSRYFNLKKFCIWIGIGIFDGLFCYIILYYIFNDDIYYYNHQSNYIAFSYILIFVIVLSVNIKIIYSTFSFGFFNIVGLLFSLSLFFIYTIVTDFLRTYGYYKGISHTYQTQKFWFITILIIFSLILLNNFYFSFKRYFYPKMKDKIRFLKDDLDNEQLIFRLEKWRNVDIKQTKFQKKKIWL